MKTKTLMLAGILSFALFAQAQNDSTRKTLQLKVSLNYNSNLNYYGRTDSLKSSGIFPLAELWFTPNFYINAAPVFINNAAQKFQYAGAVATIGYQNISDKWITGVYLTKPIYKEKSGLVQSALKAQSGATVSFLNQYLNLNAGADAKLSDKVDFGASGGVDHLFRYQLTTNSVLVIDPAFYVYAGSQNFQRSYYKKNSSGFLNFPTGNTQVTEDVQRFSILSYEASLPIIFAKSKWMLIATPTYVMPQNLITVANRPDLSERGENLFYTTLTAKYSF